MVDEMELSWECQRSEVFRAILVWSSLGVHRIATWYGRYSVFYGV